MAEGYVLSKGKRGCVLMHVRERGGVWPRGEWEGPIQPCEFVHRNLVHLEHFH